MVQRSFLGIYVRDLTSSSSAQFEEDKKCTEGSVSVKDIKVLVDQIDMCQKTLSSCKSQLLTRRNDLCSLFRKSFFPRA